MGKINRLEFDRIDITDLIIILSLAIGLIMAIVIQEKELSMSIVSGMFGYVGGGYVKQGQKHYTKPFEDQMQLDKTNRNKDTNKPTVTKDK